MTKHIIIRITALLITVALLFIPCTTGSIATEIPDYIPDEYFDLADTIAAEARNFAESVSLGEGGIPVKDMETLMTIVMNEYPELFHMTNTYSYTYNSAGMALSVRLKYKMTEEEFRSATDELNHWLDHVVSLADKSFTQTEYAIFFHDYLDANYEYDSTYTVRDVYSFIKTGHGVCQAYTYAYILLLEAVGIETSFASSSEMNHIWNLVKLDGEWYHADLTWDDPIGIIPGVAKHKYFLLSDKAISSEADKHYGWVAPYKCNSTKYDDSFINQASSDYAYLNGSWYFMKDGDLWRTNTPTEEGTLHMEMDLCWCVWESDLVYTSTYSGLLVENGKLYLNTPDSILEVDPETKETRELYHHGCNHGYVYGFVIDMGDNKLEGAGTGVVIVNIALKPGEVDHSVRVKLDGSGIIALAGSGDSNNDGKVNLSDVSLVLKYIAAWDLSMNIDAADIDQNGKVNLSDASAAMKIIAGWVG